MNLPTVDSDGDALPGDFHSYLQTNDSKPIIVLEIDFTGTGTYVRVPSERIIAFSLEDSLSGSNGYACSNTATITLDNYDKIFSPQKYNYTYDAGALHYNGVKQSDGRGNLRPWRPVRVSFEIAEYASIRVPLIDGIVDGNGFKEKIGKDNDNIVVIKINDLAKKMIDKKSPGGEVTLTGCTVPADKQIGLTGKKICDPADQSNSIVHILATTYGGMSADDVVTPQTMPIVVDYFLIDKDVWTELSLLAQAVRGMVFFYGKKLYFGDSPFFASVEDTVAFNFTNDHFNGLEISEDNESIKNKIKLTYGTYEKLGNQALWMFQGSNPLTPDGVIDPPYTFNPTDPADEFKNLYAKDRIFKCKYQIFANTPVTQAATVTTQNPYENKQKNLEVVKADNVTLSSNVGNSTGDNKISLFDTTAFPDSAVLRFIDSGVSFGISRLLISGEPYVKNTQQTATFKDANSISAYGIREESIENKYITNYTFTPEGKSAQTHAKAWGDAAIQAMKKPKLRVTFSVGFPDLLLRAGMFVTVTENKQSSDLAELLVLDGIIEKMSSSFNGSMWTVNFTVAEWTADWDATNPGIVVSGWRPSLYLGMQATHVEVWYKRSVTQPTTPVDYPPTGWTNAPPDGTDTLWQTSIEVYLDGTPV